MRVTDCADETWPTVVEENVSEVGLRESVGADAPLPMSETVCVPTESTMVNVPETLPCCVGENVTVT